MPDLLFIGTAAGEERVRTSLPPACSLGAVRGLPEANDGDGHREAPHLVLAEGSGVRLETLVAELRRRWPGAPVLGLLDTGGPESARSALQAGCSDVVEHPWTGEILARRIECQLLAALAAERRDGERVAKPGDGLHRAVLDSIDSGILAAAAEGAVLFANPYAAHWCGLLPGALEGRALADACPELDLRRRGEGDSGEVHCSRCGHRCTFGYRRHPLRHAPGVDGGEVITFTDLSGFLRARQAQRLRERLEAVSRIVGTVAHVVRNPLFAITGAAQILREELDLDADHEALLGSILVQGRRLDDVVKGLFEYAGIPSLERADCALARLFAAVVEACRETAAERGVQLVAIDDGGSVHADPVQLRRALVHLVRNAIEASDPDGSVTLRGRTGADGTTILEVEDAGTGVPADSRDSIFDLFWTTRPEHRGLGLPLCQKVIEAHGGSLTVSPGTAAGSVFTVLLQAQGVVP